VNHSSFDHALQRIFDVTGEHIPVHAHQGPQQAHGRCLPCTDKKNQIFLIYIKGKIQNGAVAKAYMTNGSSYMGKYLRISSYIRKPFLIYDFATAPL
jgi:hypothetical protein